MAQKISKTCHGLVPKKHAMAWYLSKNPKDIQNLLLSPPDPVPSWPGEWMGRLCWTGPGTGCRVSVCTPGVPIFWIFHFFWFWGYRTPGTPGRCQVPQTSKFLIYWSKPWIRVSSDRKSQLFGAWDLKNTMLSEYTQAQITWFMSTYPWYPNYLSRSSSR